MIINREYSKAIHINVTLLGDPETGKSCLMNKIARGVFNKQYSQTFGTSFMKKTISYNNKTVNKLLFMYSTF